MRKYFIIILILFTCILNAGDSHTPKNSSVFFDDENKFYYFEINPKSKPGYFSKAEKYSSRISNFLIYNLKNKKTKVMFPEDNNRIISKFIFEKTYDENRKKIILNTMEPVEQDYIHEPFVENNNNIIKRELSNSILYIIDYNEMNTRQEIGEIWKSKKDGSSLIRLYVLKNNDRWFLDLKNMRIVIVQYNYLKTKIKEFQW